MKRIATVACQIGKHKLCSGEGTHEDTGERAICACPCHEAAKTPSRARKDREQARYVVYPGQVGAEPVIVRAMGEAINLAARTRGNWERV